MYTQEQHRAKQCWWWLLISISAWFAFTSVNVHAQENGLRFDVTPIFSENQKEDENSFFYVCLEPGAKEKLGFVLHNNSNESIFLSISAHTAYTNLHGVIEYGSDAENPDASLLEPINQMLSVPGDIELAPMETKEVIITLTMPTKEVEGILAGGIRIEEVFEKDLLKEDTALALQNSFAYVIAVLASNKEVDLGTFESSNPLQIQDIYPNQVNYRNVITVDIQNPQPIFIDQLSVTAEVYHQDSEEVLYQAKKDNMQLAPNSHIPFPIYLDGERFEPGTFIMKLSAFLGEDQWTWEREFAIDGPEASTFNAKDVSIKTAISLTWEMMAIICICGAGSLGWLYYKQRKNRKYLKKYKGEENE
ncbi:DUF916 and DUF3324 domain-containing protein [Enterococcus sp.]|uniref:DUF916 and DUF3324 domain-containing protein n=1 Tax=Enterococcus sp. TaxID=35783 RepID=UPI0028982124|nr:DUF916 and DUF3324 domain-containing protein [Enterococcus sp.]